MFWSGTSTVVTDKTPDKINPTVPLIKSSFQRNTDVVQSHSFDRLQVENDRKTVRLKASEADKPNTLTLASRLEPAASDETRRLGIENKTRVNHH